MERIPSIQQKAIHQMLLDKCKCCLENGELKDMWAEYFNGEECENYGEMLTECFALSFQQPTDSIEQICLPCIGRLRDAVRFKRDILSAQQIMNCYNTADSKEVDVTIVYEVPKVENSENEHNLFCSEQNCDDEEEDIVEEGTEQEYYDEEILQEEYEFVERNSSEEDANILEVPAWEENDDAEYLEVEFLEEDGDVAVTTVEEVKQDTVKRKWPKKKSKEERTKSYRQYTKEDMKKCMEAVKSNKMSKTEAAEHFKIPIKTLRGRLHAEATRKDDQTSDDELKTYKQQKHAKFVDEVKVILTYTNATPYKTKGGRYYCAYCVERSNFIEDPDELRAHTRTAHAAERLSQVEAFMKPQWLNEVLKLDINNLLCSICSTHIDSWNDMFKHLNEVHDVELDEAYTKIVPYSLTSDLRCALCSEKFPHYHLLDFHMNAHYSNYICGGCGDTYLSESRLKKHSETHSTGKFVCKYCNKVFALDKYRKKHIDGVHSNEKRFKCMYCQEKFRAEYPRHLHVMEKHKEKVKTIKCELCHRSFDWRPYYLKHMRLKHNNQEKRHRCRMCDKRFLMRHELKNHEDWHYGLNGTECSVCGKKFSTKAYLQKHMKKTHNDENNFDGNNQ